MFYVPRLTERFISKNEPLKISDSAIMLALLICSVALFVCSVNAKAAPQCYVPNYRILATPVSHNIFFYPYLDRHVTNLAD